MSSTLANIPDTARRFTGFAEIYDKYRPSPPEVLRSTLTRFAQVSFPELVIDLGCGTGLSTRFWAGQAVRVVGVDPSGDMLQQAKAHTSFPDVAYLMSIGEHTGISSGCADLVTCSQSLHWMEPEPTLAEVARLLRPGGVFAAYDHSFYPVLPSWEADLAHRAFRKQAIALDMRYGITEKVGKWDKAEHLSKMQESGYFRYTREFMVHHEVTGNAERLIGLTRSYGAVQDLLKTGISESELGLDALTAEAYRTLGHELRPWLWNVRVWVGVK